MWLDCWLITKYYVIWTKKGVQCYTEFYVGANYKIFATQVGCGIDFDKYAFAYAKRGKKPAIGCGVVIGGHTAINILMDNEIRNTAGFR